MERSGERKIREQIRFLEEICERERDSLRDEKSILKSFESMEMKKGFSKKKQNVFGEKEEFLWRELA